MITPGLWLPLTLYSLVVPECFPGLAKIVKKTFVLGWGGVGTVCLLPVIATPAKRAEAIHLADVEAGRKMDRHAGPKRGSR
jgi:hypothetical protein